MEDFTDNKPGTLKDTGTILFQVLIVSNKIEIPPVCVYRL